MKENKNKAAIHYEKGIKHRKKNKNKNALGEFLKAEKHGLKNSKLYEEIGYLYSCLQNYTKSNEYIDKGLELKKNNGYLYYLKGYNYKNLNLYETALTYFLKSEEMGFKADYLYNGIAYIYSCQKDYEKSNEYIEKGISEYPENGYLYYLKGFNLKKIRKEEECISHYIKAAELDYNRKELYKEIAYIYSCNNLANYEKSNEYIDKALKINSKNGYLFYLKGYNYCSLENYEEALYWLKKSLKHGFRADYLYEAFAMTYVFRDKRNIKKALKYVDKGLKTSKNKDFLYALKGYIYKIDEKYDKAIHYFLKGKACVLKTDWLLEELAHLYAFYEKGKEKESIKYTNELMKIDKKSSYPHYIKFCLHLRHKKFAKAERDIKLFLEHYKNSCHNNGCLSDIYLRIKEYKKAKEYIMNALEQKESFEFKNLKNYIYATQIIIEYKLGNRDVALDLYNINKETLNKEQNAAISSYLIEIFLDKQDFKNAKLFLKNTKKSKYYNITKGNYYFALKDFNKAKKYYILEKNENMIKKETLENLITIYQSKNDNKSVDKYRKKLEKLIKEEESLKELKENI